MKRISYWLKRSRSHTRKSCVHLISKGQQIKKGRNNKWHCAHLSVRDLFYRCHAFMHCTTSMRATFQEGSVLLNNVINQFLCWAFSPSNNGGRRPIVSLCALAQQSKSHASICIYLCAVHICQVCVHYTNDKNIYIFTWNSRLKCSRSILCMVILCVDWIGLALTQTNTRDVHDHT